MDVGTERGGIPLSLILSLSSLSRAPSILKGSLGLPVCPQAQTSAALKAQAGIFFTLNVRASRAMT